MRALAVQAVAGRPLPEPVRLPELAAPEGLDEARRLGAALEHEALAALAAAGVPVAETVFCTSSTEARAAAEALGGVVAVKAAARDLPHKSAMGAVALGVEGADDCAEAFGRVVAAARTAGATPDGAVVQRQALAGRELFVGARRDPTFGPVLVIGEGGMGVEERARVQRRLLPLGRGEAAGVAEGLGGGAGAAAAIRGVEALALALGDELEALEINPLIVDGDGATAVDAVLLFSKPA